MARWRGLPDLLEAVRNVCFPFETPVSVSSRNFVGDTPLHVVACWGDVEAIGMLIQAGADVNAIGEDGFTPLREAVGQGHVAAARCLLEAGASPHIHDQLFGRTAAEEAMRSGNPELVALFSGPIPEPSREYPVT